MSLHPQPVPESFTGDFFKMEPLHPRHVELDYAAVMSTKQFLRAWSNTPWPQDDFTIEDNLKDLVWHYEEYVQQVAFAYTVLTAAGDTCIGCVYINPISKILEASAAEIALLNRHPVVCTWWLVKSLHATLQEQSFFKLLAAWLKTKWHFPGILFASNPHTPHQAAIYRENGLQLCLTLKTSSRYQYLWK
jgi:RimJ/RimL family protein N-acetyltransferase